jgi:hypothetical protein
MNNYKAKIGICIALALLLCIMCGCKSQPQEPLIVTDLEEAQSANVGDNLTLTVAAEVTDGGTLSYEWYVNGIKDTAQTSNTFTATSDTPEEFNVHCDITNTLNGKKTTIRSKTCIVTVNQIIEPSSEPMINMDLPASKGALMDETIQLSIGAESPDSGTLTYHWYVSEDADGKGVKQIAGTTDLIEFPSDTPGTFYVYCVITNQAPDCSPTLTRSTICRITVSGSGARPPEIIKDLPAAAEAPKGTAIQLSIEAESADGGELLFVWCQLGRELYRETYRETGVVTSMVSLPETPFPLPVYCEVTNTKDGETCTVRSNICYIMTSENAEPKS